MRLPKLYSYVHDPEPLGRLSFQHVRGALQRIDEVRGAQAAHYVVSANLLYRCLHALAHTLERHRNIRAKRRLR